MTTDQSDALAGVMGTTLHCLQAVVSSELAAVYDLRDGRLEARSSVGSLTSLALAPQPIELDRHPEIQRALDQGHPAAPAAQALLGRDAVPTDDHACLLIPLRCGNETLGALLLVGRSYNDADATAATAAGHGLAAALLMARRLEDVSPLGTSLLPLRKAERLHLLAALKHTGGKIYGRDGAAKLLDLKPTTLQSKLKKHGISRLDAIEPTSTHEDSRGRGEHEPMLDVVGTLPPSLGTPDTDPVATRAAE